MDICHETLVFERVFAAPPTRLFQAYRDPEMRQAWSAPSPDTAVVIDAADVRTGGRETARCGRPEDLRWRLELFYHRVIENRLIAFTETLWEGDALLTVALITFDFEPHGAVETRLRLTDQVTSFVGAGGPAGHRDGYKKALANLEKALAPV